MTSLRAPALVFFVLTASVLAQDKRAMTFEDVMKFRRISAPVIADTGTAVAYVAAPDRGDGEVLVHDLESGQRHRIERGSGPRFSVDGRWVGALVQPPAFAEGKAKRRTGFALLDLQSGLVVQWEDARGFAFADDSRYVAIHRHAPKGADDGEKTEKSKRTSGTPLLLRRLGAGVADEHTTDHVTAFAFHPDGESLLCAVAEPGGSGNGLFAWDLAGESPRYRSVLPAAGQVVTEIAWTEAGDAFAVARAAEDDDGVQGAGTVLVVRGDIVRAAAFAGARGAQWTLPAKPGLRWAKDGSWLAFGFQPAAMAARLRDLAAEKEEEEAEAEGDPYDPQRILEDRAVDVWHWSDPLINPNQKKMWSRISGKTYTAVWHREAGRLVPLCDEEMPDVELIDGSPLALGSSDAPYRREITWAGRYRDVYLVDTTTGDRTKILERQDGPAELSPDGRHVVHWRNGEWHHLSSADPHLATQLTEGGFANEDHDYPSAVPGYGFAGWSKDGGSFLIYDKYDVWSFASPTYRSYQEAGFRVLETETSAPQCLTVDRQGRTGRQLGRVFRILRLDRDAQFLDPDQPWLMSSYHDKRKNHGFYRLSPDSGLSRLLEDEARFDLVAKAEDADRILYTRESYTEFPDLWVASSDLRQPQRVSDLGRQTEDYAWGTAELVEWRSIDGTPLQGVLIKPGNYRDGERYPVLVYYYRFFSQRLHEFNQVVVNHRPCFPFYASNGYAVFLPDIRFDVGYPGYSATKCLVPGVQKLIDMGVADPDAIALHGHSWSGYQTAFVITQTDAFCCAIAGAPVSNMTSAYGGIRWQTGLSRQFQYERTQSRIGGSLWEYPERYVENSPVFFADRIETPLLIQFGDEDGAVPWYQGIELYMAMRRLGKECVFLQYRGEPHHLQKYPNKLDYSIKFKQWLDHYCKGMPAPDWIAEGVPYSGK